MHAEVLRSEEEPELTVSDRIRKEEGEQNQISYLTDGRWNVDYNYKESMKHRLCLAGGQDRRAYG